MIAGYYANPKGYLGEKVQIILKAGGSFNLNVKEADHNNLKGFDEDGIDISISLTDIDCVFEL